jgi:hypothetical protein
MQTLPYSIITYLLTFNHKQLASRPPRHRTQVSPAQLIGYFKKDPFRTPILIYQHISFFDMPTHFKTQDLWRVWFMLKNVKHIIFENPVTLEDWLPHLCFRNRNGGSSSLSSSLSPILMPQLKTVSVSASAYAMPNNVKPLFQLAQRFGARVGP